MSSKKWLKRFLFGFILFYILILILELLIDPYQVTGHSITDKKFRYTNTLETTKLFNLLKKDQKYSLMLGTSRSQQLDHDGSGIPILNLASLYGNSLNVLDFLRQLDSKQLHNIQRIYYLVDDHCLNGYDTRDLYSRYKKQDYNKSELFFKIKFLLNINLKKIQEMISDIYYNLFGYSYYINNLGVMVRVDENESCEVPKQLTFKPTRQFYTKDGIEALSAIDRFCKKHHIKISYFTPTHFSLNNKLQDTAIMKKKWSAILKGGIDGFYALWYIEGVSNKIKDNRYVCFKNLDSHLNSYYNNKVFIDNIVKEDKQYYISNIDELVKYISRNKEHFK